ncbi:MAG: hypothetical protein DYH17_10590 [Xanthomonadales bacterium PRO6]|nr:hypothetical protein [Xanthomonadales bacterium PRO6]
MLALLEVDVYQQRAQRPTQAGAGDRDADPLARAIARAAGYAEVAVWRNAWLAAGQTLPDLATLRAGAEAKRALWKRIRRLPR